MAVVLKPDADLQPGAASNPGGLAGFNLSDLAMEGHQQLESCRLEAEQILVAARQQAEQIRAAAQQHGYQDGLDQASQQIEQKIQESAEQRAHTGLDLVRSAVDQLHQEHQEWMMQYSGALAEMALAATLRIVGKKLEQEPELVVAWAEDAVRSTRTASELTVAVNPETLAQLGQSLDEMLAAPDLPEGTRVVPDETVGPTEVVVRQSGGEIQAGLHAQLKRLEELLS